MVSNNSSRPIDGVQVPGCTGLSRGGASQRRGEPSSYLSQLHRSEDTEERRCSLVARSQQRRALVLARAGPTVTWARLFFPNGNFKAPFKRVTGYNDKVHPGG